MKNALRDCQFMSLTHIPQPVVELFANKIKKNISFDCIDSFEILKYCNIFNYHKLIKMSLFNVKNAISLLNNSFNLFLPPKFHSHNNESNDILTC